jgi:hypothetical protein
VSPTSSYEREAEEFLAQLEQEDYLNAAGLQETFDLSAIYGKYSHLFTRDSVQDLLGRRDTKGGRYLACFAAVQYLGGLTRTLTEKIVTAETQTTLEWDRRSIPYRLGWVLLHGEPDHSRRRQLHRHLLSITEQHNQLRASRIARLHAGVKALGFDDYNVFCDDLMGLSLQRLAPQMQELLARTRTPWRQGLMAILHRNGISPDSADAADLAYLMTFPRFESVFPKDELIPTLSRTFAGLGIAIEDQSNLHLDTEERPLKSPRAFCSPIRVPSDVRLAITPRGGQDDYNTLFHETGHAEHFVHTDSAAPFPFRCLGDTSVTEGYAFLFNLLLQSPAWPQQPADVELHRAYIRFSRLRQQYYLRRYAAKLAYEQKLHASDTPNPDFARLYAQSLGDALAVEAPQASFLADLDDDFTCACYLRGWMLEVQLRRRLTERFGDTWFTRREAGDFLKQLWKLGQEFTADEIAQRLGYSGLDPELLIEDLVASPDG